MATATKGGESASAAAPSGGELESIMDDKEKLLRFRDYLVSIFSAENFDFWLEAESFRHLLVTATINERAKQMYAKYFAEDCKTPVNIEDASQEEEVKKRLKENSINCELFVKLQNTVWGLIKFDCFPRFKTSTFFIQPITKQQKASYKKLEVMVYLEELVKRVKKAKKKGLPLPLLDINKSLEAAKQLEKERKPVDPMDEKLYDIPDIEEIFEDEPMMLAFREFLHQTQANENLAFWLESEIFRHIENADQMKLRAQEIFDKFCTSESPQAVNLDFHAREVLRKSLAHPSQNMFRDSQKVTWKVLKNEWFPVFCASKVFQDCNDDAVSFKKSHPGRERANTMDTWDNLQVVKKAVEAQGRDFWKEINEEEVLAQDRKKKEDKEKEKKEKERKDREKKEHKEHKASPPKAESKRKESSSGSAESPPLDAGKKKSKRRSNHSNISDATDD